MIRVAVSGCAGRMGRHRRRRGGRRAGHGGGLRHRPARGRSGAFPVFASVAEALDGAEFDVLVDFTQPSVVAGNLRAALPAGVDCVVGTTGLSNACSRSWPRSPCGHVPVLRAELHHGRRAHDGVREGRRALLPGGRGHRVPPLQQEGRPLGHRGAHGRDHRRGARRARERGPRARNGDRRAPRARAARSWRACRCTPYAPWAT